jgi:hypothetical protein
MTRASRLINGASTSGTQTLDPNDPIVGLKGPTGDNYFYPHTQFDVQGSYRIYKGIQIVASGLNLSNEVFGFYNGSTIYRCTAGILQTDGIFRRTLVHTRRAIVADGEECPSDVSWSRIFSPAPRPVPIRVNHPTNLRRSWH